MNHPCMRLAMFEVAAHFQAWVRGREQMVPCRQFGCEHDDGQRLALPKQVF